MPGVRTAEFKLLDIQFLRTKDLVVSLKYMLMISILSGRSLLSSFISRMTVFLASLSNSYRWCFWRLLKIPERWVPLRWVYPPHFGSRRGHGITFSRSAQLSPALIRAMITYGDGEVWLLPSSQEVCWDWLIVFIRFSFLARSIKIINTRSNEIQIQTYNKKLTL